MVKKWLKSGKKKWLKSKNGCGQKVVGQWLKCGRKVVEK
jgi:hypothetical protein